MKNKGLILKLVAAMLFVGGAGATSVAAMESLPVNKTESSQVDCELSEEEKKFILGKLTYMGVIVSDEKKFLEEFNLSKLKLLADKIADVLGKIEKLQNLQNLQNLEDLEKLDLEKLDLEKEIKSWKVSINDVDFSYNFSDVLSNRLFILKGKLGAVVYFLSNLGKILSDPTQINNYKNYLNSIEREKAQKEKLNKEQEEKLNKEQEEKLKKEQEEKLKKEQEERLKKEQKERSKKEQEERSKKRQEEKSKKRQEEKSKKRQEEKSKKRQEEKSKKGQKGKLKKRHKAGSKEEWQKDIKKYFLAKDLERCIIRFGKYEEERFGKYSKEDLEEYLEEDSEEDLEEKLKEKIYDDFNS